MSTTKKIPSQEAIAEAQAILALAMSTPSSVADIFVDYYSHTGSIDVRCHDYGWTQDVDVSEQWHLYSDDDDARNRLATIRSEVEQRVAHLSRTAKDTPHVAAQKKAERLRAAAQALLATADGLVADEAAEPEREPNDEPDYDAPRPLTAMENWQRNDEHNVP